MSPPHKEQIPRLVGTLSIISRPWRVSCAFCAGLHAQGAPPVQHRQIDTQAGAMPVLQVCVGGRLSTSSRAIVGFVRIFTVKGTPIRNTPGVPEPMLSGMDRVATPAPDEPKSPRSVGLMDEPQASIFTKTTSLKPGNFESQRSTKPQDLSVLARRRAQRYW